MRKWEDYFRVVGGEKSGRESSKEKKRKKEVR